MGNKELTINRTIKRKGFKALLVTQFLGAFNDNAFKFVISLLAVDLFVRQTGGTEYLSISGAIFILPFLLFSLYAGFLADKFSKRNIIIGSKILELIVMLLGLLALIVGNIWGIFIILFFMGTQSAFFSPAKYGILPEILRDEDLSEGNGAIQLWTYLAIISGMVCGGYLYHISKPDVFKVSYIFIAISVLGVITSFFITKVKPSGAERQFEWNFLKEVIQNVRKIKKDRPLFLSILGLAYFAFLGGLFHLNIILYTRKVMEASALHTGILLTTVALGLGLGSFLAGKWSERKIEFGLVPLGAIGLSLFSIILSSSYNHFLLTAICLFALGISGGFFIVPLNAFVQHRSPLRKRGQILATMNILSFFAILLSSGILYILREMINFNAAEIFTILGIATIGATGYICSLLPDWLLRFIIWLLTHTIYKIKVVGEENIPKEGGALLVCNHVSYVDWALILTTLQRNIRFVTDRQFMNLKLIKPFLKLAKAIPVSEHDGPKKLVKSLNLAKQALKEGELVCLFAEGRLTRTGNILQFRKGLEHIVKGTNCPIIPVHLDRIWGSIFSYERGKYFFKIPKIIPYPVTVSYGKPLPSDSTAFEVRNKVMELGSEAFKYRIKAKDSLPIRFWQEARKNPLRQCIVDTTGKRFNFAQTLISSVALNQKIRTLFPHEEKIGIILPPSVAAVLSNIAISIANKVPINLNYTASQEVLSSIIKQCNIKHIITSKKFLKKINLSFSVNKIFIEELIKHITIKDKLLATVKSFIYPSFVSRRFIFGKSTPQDIYNLATIIFTSGSTGEPKGVMLTHANIESNLEGLYQIFHISKKDLVLGILPFFHSFGYTATLWFPLLSGIGAVYHMNPLDAKRIGKIAHQYKATILMSTPTFLTSYIRRCNKKQFESLRIVIVGAEKLKDKIGASFKDKFGIQPMEGYGCSELSPIVSVNLPDFRKRGERQKAYKPGKIGKPLPGIAIKILDKDSLKPVGPNEDGILFVKGPNVMKGYLNKPEETKEVLEDGWYNTKDIANMDEEGFLTITDRLSRFSKIGGEMVPHVKIEEAIQSTLDTTETNFAVTSVSDKKKGERLVVLYSGSLDVESIIRSLKQSNLPNLWIPDKSSFYKVDSIPVLGSGKLNLSKLKEIAQDMVRDNTKE